MQLGTDAGDPHTGIIDRRSQQRTANHCSRRPSDACSPCPGKAVQPPTNHAHVTAAAEVEDLPWLSLRWSAILVSSAKETKRKVQPWRIFTISPTGVWDKLGAALPRRHPLQHKIYSSSNHFKNECLACNDPPCIIQPTKAVWH